MIREEARAASMRGAKEKLEAMWNRGKLAQKRRDGLLSVWVSLWLRGWGQTVRAATPRSGSLLSCGGEDVRLYANMAIGRI